MSRLVSFQNKVNLGGSAPLLTPPGISAGRHLIDHLFEVGPGVDGQPVTFQELQAWAGLTGNTLTAWEASTLRLLSAAYMSELLAAEDPKRPPPFSGSSPE